MSAANISPDGDNVLTRLRRIEGQIRGLQRLVEEETDCEKFLTQLSAARAALDKVGLIVIGKNMKECLAGSGGAGSKVEEALQLFLRHSGQIS